jgi:hypothetical protein
MIYAIFDAIEPDEYGCCKYPSRNGTTYPLVWLDGRQHRVHRLALERKLGRPIKPGFKALHECDYPPCVNPDHLYEGTDADNVHDTMERCPGAREQIVELGKKMGKIMGPIIGGRPRKQRSKNFNL